MRARFFCALPCAHRCAAHSPSVGLANPGYRSEDEAFSRDRVHLDHHGVHSVGAQQDGSTPAPAADPAKAQSTATTLCAACHGADGNSPLPVNPNLAAQHPEYLFKQLADYKTGRRKNAIMNGIAASLSDADMRNLAAYFAQQPAKPAAAKDRELALSGQQLYRGGICHGRCAGLYWPAIRRTVPASRSNSRGSPGNTTNTRLRSCNCFAAASAPTTPIPSCAASPVT